LYDNTDNFLPILEASLILCFYIGISRTFMAFLDPKF
jgi:hypothetical protein